MSKTLISRYAGVKVKKKPHKVITMKMDVNLWRKIEEFRWKHRMASITATVEFLCDHALKTHPTPPKGV
jgi:hypothetical protein